MKNSPEPSKDHSMDNLKNKLSSFLNSEQIDAVLTDPPLLIIAGPGSGKTHTITQKIALQLVQKEDDLNNTLVLTFTNNAAASILSRINEVLKSEIPLNKYYIGTFHGIFYKIFRENRSHFTGLFNFYSFPSIIDSSQEKRIFDSVIFTALAPNLKMKKREFNDWFLKKYNLMPNDILNITNSIVNYGVDDFPQLFKKVGERLMDNGTSEQDAFAIETMLPLFYKLKLRESILSFSDILLYMYFFVRYDNNMREYLREKFNYVVVDEYQDTNPIEDKILQYVSRNENNFIAVGDPYQSIYAFLGAQVKNIVKKANNPKIKNIQLIKNYRSTPNIVNFTNDVASLFIDRVDGYKSCISAASGLKNNKIQCFTYSYPEAIIVNKILALKKEKVSLRDIAVISRTNFETFQLEKSFKNNNIPYKKRGGTGFFDKKEIKILTDFLKVYFDRYNIDNYIEVLLQFDRIGLAKLTKIRNRYIYSEIKDPFPQYIESEFSKDKLLISAISQIKQGEKSYKGFISFLKSPNINLFQKLSKTGKTKTLQESILNNMKLFLEDMNESGFFNNIDDLFYYLDTLFLDTNKDNNDTTDDIDKVTITTAHSSKGLEWGTVFILNASPGNFPSAMSSSKRAIEEEKRLFYVAISRAKHSLFLLSSVGLTPFVEPFVNKDYMIEGK